MSVSEFNRPVATDSVPDGSMCEWCGKQAEQCLTAIGGTYQNTNGIFCRSCGEQFVQVVAQKRSVLMQPVPLLY